MAKSKQKVKKNPEHKVEEYVPPKESNAFKPLYGIMGYI